LVGGSTPVADALQIHQMSMAGGVMSMRPVTTGVVIGPGATLTINPRGGYHLMLTGLKAPLKQGDRIPAKLNFAKAGSVDVEFTVGAIGALELTPASAMDHR
jgi:copper(I)-binding protein